MPALKRIGVVALIAMIVALAMQAGPSARAQDDESDDGPTIETTRTARTQTDEDEPDPSDESTGASDEDQAPAEGTDIDSSDDSDESGSPSPNQAAIDVVDIYQTIAQGLAAFDAFPNGVWRITEIKPKPAGEAPSVTAPYYGFLYQMDGTTIVRNDTTGKRARLEPGEAYYFSANDTYTRYREDEVSRAWLIEVVPEDADPADAAGTVIYTSEEIGSLPDDTRDLELIAGNLAEDEVSDLPDFEVDVLVMVTVGTIELSDDDGTTRMVAPAALLVSTDFTLTNDSNDPAVYTVAKVGPAVADAVPAASGDAAADGTEDSVESGEDTEEPEVDPMLDTDADGLIDTDEAVYGTDPEIADTDFDGYSDGDEVIVYGTDPLDDNSWP